MNMPLANAFQKQAKPNNILEFSQLFEALRYQWVLLATTHF